MLSHADATRYDVLAFLQRTWNVQVSTVALHHFCKKFGLDRAARTAALVPPAIVPGTPTERALSGQPVPLPPPPFSEHGLNTRARSC
ncbi:MAG: hypothetical protein JNM56_01295 [Planctomycetia bacterium]|nr:hypothetical protein [Planctomycetia bacterium]